MGAAPVKDWAEVVSQANVASPSTPKLLAVTRVNPVPKKKHPKRRPKELRQKTYTQVAITSPRAVYTDKREERLSRQHHRGWKRVY
jgi:hypothetical protein